MNHEARGVLPRVFPANDDAFCFQRIHAVWYGEDRSACPQYGRARIERAIKIARQPVTSDNNQVGCPSFSHQELCRRTDGRSPFRRLAWTHNLTEMFPHLGQLIGHFLQQARGSLGINDHAVVHERRSRFPGGGAD